MEKIKKPVYEAPAIIPLGELARGAGIACNPVGSGATGKCGGGPAVPPPTCSRGVKATGSCSQGPAVGT